MSLETKEVVRAHVYQLSGKHYATEVAVKVFGKTYSIKVAIPVGRPSNQELRASGLTPQQWRDNALVWDGWADDGLVNCRDADMIDFSHYQSCIEMWVAHKIAAALDGQTPPDDCLE